MRLTLPHANGYRTDAMEFVAAWQVIGELYGPPGWKWQTGVMPRHNRVVGLAAAAAEGLQFGVDVLCRCIASALPQHDAGHEEFIQANAAVIQPCKTRTNRRRINGVMLSVAAVTALWALPSGRPARRDRDAVARDHQGTPVPGDATRAASAAAAHEPHTRPPVSPLARERSL